MNSEDIDNRNKGKQCNNFTNTLGPYICHLGTSFKRSFQSHVCAALWNSPCSRQMRRVPKIVQSTVMTWRLRCLMCCTCLSPHGWSPLPFVVSPKVSVCPFLAYSLVSMGNASASSRQSRTARCKGAWQWPHPPPCSSMPSQSDKNLQSRVKD